MTVNFGLLGDEPIENLITCMNFEIDKAVFFGYNRTLKEQKEKTERFLKENCGVREVSFHALSQKDLRSSVRTMRREVRREFLQHNDLYFDITGGKPLSLVAVGILAKEFDLPIHLYDIPSGRLTELKVGRPVIRDHVPRKTVPMSLELLIEMHGGKINERFQKDYKERSDTDFSEDIRKLYEVSVRNTEYWNPFSDFLKTALASDDLQVCRELPEVKNALSSSRTALKTRKTLDRLVDELAETGALTGVERENGQYRFRFKNREIRECLRDGGSLLELYTFYQEAERSRDCRCGVHIDWDGVIHRKPGIDVLNEIDVLALEGYTPVFISCKSGKLDGQQTLHALYELETVASRFGGKYAKKILVTMKNPGTVYRERAREMGIELRSPGQASGKQKENAPEERNGPGPGKGENGLV